MFNLFGRKPHRSSTFHRPWKIHYINPVKPLEFQLKYVVCHINDRIRWKQYVYIAYSADYNKYFVKPNANSKALQFNPSEITILSV